MATSNEDYLPRNIEFLYDKNRLNVAVSRAKCLAIVVASPDLLKVHCGTPEQMELVNTLCWLREYSMRRDEDRWKAGADDSPVPDHERLRLRQ